MENALAGVRSLAELKLTSVIWSARLASKRLCAEVLRDVFVGPEVQHV